MRKWILTMMAALLMTAVCGSALASGVTLRVFTPFADADFAAQAYMDAVTAWENETGNLVEDYSGTQDEMWLDQLMTMLDSDEADVVVVPVGMPVDGKQVVTAQELAGALDEGVGRLFTSMKESDGSTLLVPVRLNWEALYVNEDVLTANGLAVPATYEQLLAVTTVENPTDTRILTISVTNPDPTLAKQIVDQYAQVSRKRIAELMDINEPGIIEEGHVAEKKTSPTTTKNALIAGILGIFLAAAIVIVRYLMDDTIKSSEDVERYLGLNTLGILPIEENALKEEQREQMARQAAKKKEEKSQGR